MSFKNIYTLQTTMHLSDLDFLAYTTAVGKEIESCTRPEANIHDHIQVCDLINEDKEYNDAARAFKKRLGMLFIFVYECMYMHL